MGLVLAAGIVGVVLVTAAGGLPAPSPVAATTEAVEPSAAPGAAELGSEAAPSTTAATAAPSSETGPTAPGAAGVDDTVTPTRTLSSQGPGLTVSENSGPGYLRTFLAAKRTQIADPQKLEDWWRSSVWYRRYPQYRRPLTEVLAELGVSAQPAAGQTWTQIQPPTVRTSPQTVAP